MLHRSILVHQADELNTELAFLVLIFLVVGLFYSNGASVHESGEKRKAAFIVDHWEVYLHGWFVGCYSTIVSPSMVLTISLVVSFTFDILVVSYSK